MATSGEVPAGFARRGLVGVGFSDRGFYSATDYTPTLGGDHLT